MQELSSRDMSLRDAKPAMGHGLGYACRTARAWWYSAWLRTLARFSRTTLGSFWMGLSNLLSVGVLGVVYGTVLKVDDPLRYIIYLGFGVTIWGRADSKYQQGLASGWRLANASSAVMS
jgi:lipopolysaccharide transport system permease protein